MYIDDVFYSKKSLVGLVIGYWLCRVFVSFLTVTFRTLYVKKKLKFYDSEKETIPGIFVSVF